MEEIVGRTFKLLPTISNDYEHFKVKSYPMGFIGSQRIYDHNGILKRIIKDIFQQDTSLILYFDEIFVSAINDLGLVKYIRISHKFMDVNDIQKLIKYKDNYQFQYNITNTALVEVTSVNNSDISLIPSDVVKDEETFKKWCYSKQPIYLDDFIEKLNILNNMNVVEDYIKSKSLNVDLSKYHSEIRDLKISGILG